MGDMQAWGIVIWGVVGLIAGTVLRRLSDASAPPAVLEVASAALFACLAWRVGPEPHLLAYSALGAVSVPLAAIDLTESRLPNRLIFPAYPTVLGLLVIAAVIEHQGPALVRALTASVVLLAGYGLPYLVWPTWLSGGDVKLAGLLGMATGWASWNVVLTGIVLCWVFALLGVMVAAMLRATLRSTRSPIRQGVPLGPFMITGAFTALVFGSA